MSHTARARPPEFQRQNREFAAAVETAGKKVRLLVGEHYNHFELPETLCNPYGLLKRAALNLMSLIAESPAMTPHRRMVRHGELRWRLDASRV